MIDSNSKKQYFARIAEGDKSAFDVFFKHYYPKLIKFAQIYVDSVQQAEDVVADVLTNVLINRKRVFALDHFESYLYFSVKNKSITSIKRQQRENPFIFDSNEFILNSMAVADPHDLLVGVELQDQVNQITQQFPPKRKMVFQLIREEGFTYRQVAELMNISERTVEVHLKLAVKELREGIEIFLGDGRSAKITQKAPAKH
ncbi:RNA polymerase sigma-70 factor [Dyadobacter sp. CY327]|uniref:RNA polymerase sigma-70 factor n=1 Tax=Dyadobacter sp. CY327 TaxID=2907301 RepID=UPI001F16B72D|nr:RNA polymerase sigma-70 factor [Dyadobacter sp. CY327]MCE7070832.1 RNA polymerase sigma-70 factor [Dyadobacter sp. CY327]